MQAKLPMVHTAAIVHVTIVNVMPLLLVNGLQAMQKLQLLVNYVVTATMKHVLPIVKKQAYLNMQPEHLLVPDAEQPYIPTLHVIPDTRKTLPEPLVLKCCVTMVQLPKWPIAEHQVQKVGN